MLVTLKPNAELDILTKDELEEVLTRLRDQQASGYGRDPVLWRDFNSTKLDANGNSGVAGVPIAQNPSPVNLYRGKSGQTIILHRLAVQAEGVAFATTFTGYLYLLRGDRMIDFANLANGFPIVFLYTSNAPWFTDQEAIQIQVSGGPANANLIVDAQGTITGLTTPTGVIGE